MRHAIAVFVLTAACHQPSLKDRAIGLGNKIVATARRIDASISPEAKAQLQAVAITVATAKANQIIAAHVQAAPAPMPPPMAEPDAPDEPAPQPAMVPATVEVHEQRTAPASTFAARYKGANGWTCTAYSTMAACQSSCMAIARQAAAARGDAQCSCLEDSACP